MKNTVFLYSFILIALTTAQCRKQSGVSVSTTNMTTDTVPASAAAKTFLALGDSYTIGQSVTSVERFPAQTAAILRSYGINIAEPKYVATTGWTTDNLSQAISDQNITGPYSVVTLLIGVNDQYQRHDTTGYRERFRSLLLKSIIFAGSDRSKVFVVSIPDYSVTPYASYSDTAFIRMQIDQFNNINREETQAAFCNYLDITPSTREAAFDPSLIASDGLHPSGKEYNKWAMRLAPIMKPVLQ